MFDIFLIFAQNIDCGYTLEPPRREDLGNFTEVLNLFEQRFSLTKDVLK